MGRGRLAFAVGGWSAVTAGALVVTPLSVAAQTASSWFPTHSAMTDTAVVEEVERVDGVWAVRVSDESLATCVARYTAALESGTSTAAGQVVGLARDPHRDEWNVSVVRDGYALYLIQLRDVDGRCEESLRTEGRGVHDADLRVALPPVWIRGVGEIDLDTL